MRAIDTNVLVRLLARDDEKQTEAADRFVSPGAWVSHLVLVEACSVLRSAYGLRKEKIATAVEMLLKHAELTIQDADSSLWRSIVFDSAKHRAFPTD